MRSDETSPTHAPPLVERGWVRRKRSDEDLDRLTALLLEGVSVEVVGVTTQ